MYESQTLDSLTSNNSTDGKVDVVFATLIPILSLVAVLLNLATIIAFWQFTRLRNKPSELLILNLSCADLIIGLLVMPLWSPVYITPGSWPMGENGCRIAILVLNMGVHGSLFALLSISIDRFLLISMDYPRYVHIQTNRTIRMIIASCWILALLTVAIELGFGIWQRQLMKMLQLLITPNTAYHHQDDCHNFRYHFF